MNSADAVSTSRDQSQRVAAARACATILWAGGGGGGGGGGGRGIEPFQRLSLLLIWFDDANTAKRSCSRRASRREDIMLAVTLDLGFFSLKLYF